MEKKFNHPIVICMTPVVNEGWVLERFISATSLWADVIIIGDQNSQDNTREITAKYDKVILIDNPHKDYNEVGMREILYEAARKVHAPKKVLISLDADEILSANFHSSAEWSSILDLPVGSIIRMPIHNLNPDMQTYTPLFILYCGFVDDGTAKLTGDIMHSIRTPWPSAPETLIYQTSCLIVLHYAHVNIERVRAKYRWYSAYEKISRGNEGISSLRFYRKYYADLKNFPIKPEWFNYYNQNGIDITSIHFQYDYSHDYRVLEYLDEYGAQFFRKCDLWDQHWVAFAKGKKENPERFADPRTWLDRMALRYAMATLNKYPKRSKWLFQRFVDAIFKILGY